MRVGVRSPAPIHAALPEVAFCAGTVGDRSGSGPMVSLPSERSVSPSPRASQVARIAPQHPLELVLRQPSPEPSPAVLLGAGDELGAEALSLRRCPRSASVGVLTSAHAPRAISRLAPPSGNVGSIGAPGPPSRPSGAAHGSP